MRDNQTIEILTKIADDYKQKYNLLTRVDIASEGFYCYYQTGKDYIAYSLQKVEKFNGGTASLKQYIGALLHELKHAIDYNTDKGAFEKELEKCNIALYEDSKEYHNIQPFEIRANEFARQELEKWL